MPTIMSTASAAPAAPGAAARPSCWPARATANMSEFIEKLTGNKLARRQMMDIEVRDEAPAPRRHRGGRQGRDRGGKGGTASIAAIARRTANTTTRSPRWSRHREARGGNQRPYARHRRCAAAAARNTAQNAASAAETAAPRTNRTKSSGSQRQHNERARATRGGGQEPASRLPVPPGAGEEARTQKGRISLAFKAVTAQE